MREFLTTPSRARANAAIIALVVAGMVISAVTENLIPLSLWGLATLWVALFLLHDGTGGVANNASILAGRPIAFTARSRARVSLSHVTPELQRLSRRMAGGAAFVMVLAFVVVALNS
jgi:hypothetical protein